VHTMTALALPALLAATSPRSPPKVMPWAYSTHCGLQQLLTVKPLKFKFITLIKGEEPEVTKANF